MFQKIGQSLITLGAMAKAAIRWAARAEGLGNKQSHAPFRRVSGVFVGLEIGWRNYQMKASILVLSALYCIGISVAFADSSEAPSAGIIVGERLVAAKAKLIKQGWKPTRLHTNDGYEYSGVEKELAAHKFFELDTCSFDSSRCILYYAKKGSCLRVDTIGEQFNDMSVTRWTRECPEAPQ
ncbi:hypothetical protein [Pseudomonas sp. PB106]|uniref:hypothetical protein n=1 Tax=Pseudomonas sp. PB106 TaxID=2494699 RepID=UPI002113EE94|nr:hypothetical protein [Pseudomonas sp. PB106]